MYVRAIKFSVPFKMVTLTIFNSKVLLQPKTSHLREAMQLEVKIENQIKPHNCIFQLWCAPCCTWAEWEEGKGNCDKKKKKVPQVGILEEASAPRQEYLGDTWPGAGRGPGILEHSRRETCLNLEYQTMCNRNLLGIFKRNKRQLYIL